jgi:hypothetical protein
MTIVRGAIVVLIACLLPACQASMSARGSGSASGQAHGQTQGKGTGKGGAQPASPPGGTATLGACPRIEGNGQVVNLPAGTCTGDLEISGNGHKVTGAGTGQTIVEGRLVLSGNGHVVSGLTVIGPSEVSGHDNDARGVEFRSSVDVSGHGNRR